jgi:hypothetical protein
MHPLVTQFEYWDYYSYRVGITTEQMWCDGYYRTAIEQLNVEQGHVQLAIYYAYSVN